MFLLETTVGRELAKSEASERSEELEEVEEHLFVPSAQLTFVSDGFVAMVCGWALENYVEDVVLGFELCSTNSAIFCVS